jgi:DNA polymerase I-like protein with 3'-5' exonuclease and polymerase domains
MTFIQKPMFEPNSDWKLPTTFPSWEGARRVAIDLETRDPDLKQTGIGVRREGRIVGVAYAIDGGPSAYLPVGHAGPNLDPGLAFRYLQDQAKHFDGEIVGANLPYDLDYLAEVGVWFGEATFRDVQVAAPLLDELQMSYSLAAIAKRAGIAGKSEDGLRAAAASYGVDPKAEMWKLPARHVAEYAVQDVLLPLQLIRQQHNAIDEQGLWDIYNLESEVLPILVKMRRRGVRLDLDKLQKVEEYARAQIRQSLHRVKVEAGYELTEENLTIAEAIEGALNAVGLEVGKTAGRKGKDGIYVAQKPKTDRATLEALDHPVANHILRAKKFEKVISTFVASIHRHQVNGRIHPTFRQLRGESDFGGTNGAAFGRLSCVDPNLQQQPARDPEIGKMWRSIYVPEDGEVWACCDFSSQEPRIAAHYAGVSGAGGADKIVAAYNENPRLDFHQKMADLAGIKRKDAKAIFLGLCYGMGGGKLCRSLGLPTETVISKRTGKKVEIAGREGEALLKKFDEMVPWVRQLSKMAETRAKNKGYIVTLGGRRCRFPYSKNGMGYDWTYKSLNRLIQGSAADQGKRALIELDKAGFPIQLQVHDEFDLSVPDRDYAQKVAEVMIEATPLAVPVVVDVECGPSWGEIE